MSRIQFDDGAVLKTCGLVNTGVICYLNSFLQSLLSCTSVTAFFLENEQRLEENAVATEYIKLIKAVRGSNGPAQVFDPVGIFDAVIKSVRAKRGGESKVQEFGSGQEDSGEGLHMFLDAIDDKGLYRLFMYRYNVLVWCIDCSKSVSKTTDESCVLEVPDRYTGLVTSTTGTAVTQDPLNMHIRQCITMLSDYKCAECTGKKCCRIYQLASAPEIITVLFNKFYKKTNLNFPPTLEFASKTGPVLKYRVVAKIEHSGGQSGGHYWAHCLRDGSRVDDSLVGDMAALSVAPGRPGIGMYQLNDRTVSAGTYAPSPNTYMVFYHNC